MGCTASQLMNEDTVSRCKQRRSLMKRAVQARHHLAAAHSDYLRSLRNTGSAFTNFSSFLSISIVQSDQCFSPVVLRSYPPPPLSTPTTNTVSSPPQTNNSKEEKKSTFASKTTSRSSSSVWNWEEYYPPSPPGSDFFDGLDARREKEHIDHHLSVPDEDDDSEEEEEEVGSFFDRYSRTTCSSKMTSPMSSEFLNMKRSKATPPPVSEFKGEEAGMMQAAFRHRNLKEVAAALEENFVKAACAGRGFLDLLNASHCSTLERLLAWEQKLYKEVKVELCIIC